GFINLIKEKRGIILVCQGGHAKHRDQQSYVKRKRHSRFPMTRCISLRAKRRNGEVSLLPWWLKISFASTVKSPTPKKPMPLFQLITTRFQTMRERKASSGASFLKINFQWIDLVQEL